MNGLVESILTTRPWIGFVPFNNVQDNRVLTVSDIFANTLVNVCPNPTTFQFPTALDITTWIEQYGGFEVKNFMVFPCKTISMINTLTLTGNTGVNIIGNPTFTGGKHLYISCVSREQYTVLII